jgi:cytoskeletal protein CcmA (bactofilin family)
MLLTRLHRTVIRLRRDDEGVAMAAVLGLMAVSALLTALVAGSVVTSMGRTSATRAGIQSQAAAEAGVAAARAGLIAGSCLANGGVYQSAAGAVPAYKATIWVPLTASTWTRSCPVGTTTQVRILSTGYANSPGVDGVTFGDTANIEAILSSASTPTQLSATGPAVYAYSSLGFGGGGRLLSAGGDTPDVLVKTGDLDCTGGAQGATDLVVNSGNLIIDSGCQIAGNAWASGSVTMPGGPNVGGNVIGNGVSISGGTQVGGNVYSSGPLYMTGGPAILGYATAASLNLQGGTIAKNAWIYGSSTLNWGGVINGSITTKTLSVPNYSNLIGGTKTITNPSTPGASPYPTPTTPVVPNWIDFGSQAADYTPSVWTGFAVYTMGSDCSYPKVASAMASFTGPGIIDARACSNGIKLGFSGDGGTKYSVNNDLAIIGKDLEFGGGAGFTTSSAHRLWLINPDTVGNSLPDCNGQKLQTTGGFTYSPKLSVMMYSPCAVAVASGTTFTGQVFAGQASIDGGSTITYQAIGLPGYDLNSGTRTTSTSTEADRSLLSQRNVTATN